MVCAVALTVLAALSVCDAADPVELGLTSEILLDEGAPPSAAVKAAANIKKYHAEAKRTEKATAAMKKTIAQEKKTSRKAQKKSKAALKALSTRLENRATKQALKTEKKVVQKSLTSRPPRGMLKDFKVVVDHKKGSITASERSVKVTEKELHYDQYTDAVKPPAPKLAKGSKQGPKMPNAKSPNRIPAKTKKPKKMKKAKAAPKPVAMPVAKNSLQNAQHPCAACHRRCKTHACKSWCDLRWCRTRKAAPIDSTKPMASQQDFLTPYHKSTSLICEGCQGPIGDEAMQHWCNHHGC